MNNLLQAGAVNLIMGLVIRANTGGDKAKESARATEIMALVNAAEEIVDGNVATGLAGVQTAIQGSKSIDPAEALAIQNFIGFLATQGAAAQQLLGGTVAGQLDAALAANIGAEVIATCKAYVVAPAAPPAVA